MTAARLRHGVSGEVRVPGDKSVSHRALIFAALADGQSRIRGLLDSADVRSTASVLSTLGVAVPTALRSAATDGGLMIRGRGLRGLRAPARPLDCGNSGTTTRLMAGVCAGHDFESRFVGDASLSRRPMGRVARPLTAMGARVTFDHDDTLPMTLCGASLHSISWINETASAQVKSAILLAGTVAGVPVTIRASHASRDHTERFLDALGGRIVHDVDSVSLVPPSSLRSFSLEVPGDPSSAAFFAALAALAPAGSLHLPHVLASPTRDGFFRVLAAAGAIVLAEHEGETEVGEVTTAYTVRPGSLRGVRIGADEVPTMIDELPLVACVGARAVGETVITGAQELRVKESDRIAVTVANLRSIGVEAEELADGLRIVGSDRPLRGVVRTHGDHRIAMAFGVLSMLADSDLTIDDPGCVDVSYPRYWADLARVAA
jgi:3-phosphoshikimate 1-carboxyvinyltransferase